MSYTVLIYMVSIKMSWMLVVHKSEAENHLAEQNKSNISTQTELLAAEGPSVAY